MCVVHRKHKFQPSLASRCKTWKWAFILDKVISMYINSSINIWSLNHSSSLPLMIESSSQSPKKNLVVFLQWLRVSLACGGFMIILFCEPAYPYFCVWLTNFCLLSCVFSHNRLLNNFSTAQFSNAKLSLIHVGKKHSGLHLSLVLKTASNLFIFVSVFVLLPKFKDLRGFKTCQDMMNWWATRWKLASCY